MLRTADRAKPQACAPYLAWHSQPRLRVACLRSRDQRAIIYVGFVDTQASNIGLVSPRYVRVAAAARRSIRPSLISWFTAHQLRAAHSSSACAQWRGPAGLFTERWIRSTTTTQQQQKQPPRYLVRCSYLLKIIVVLPPLAAPLCWPPRMWTGSENGYSS